MYRESNSGLAYFGDVSVYKVYNSERLKLLFSDYDTWIPISMCDNPWWICTVKFNYSGKVANKRFDEDDFGE